MSMLIPRGSFIFGKLCRNGSQTCWLAPFSIQTAESALVKLHSLSKYIWPSTENTKMTNHCFGLTDLLRNLHVSQVGVLPCVREGALWGRGKGQQLALGLGKDGLERRWPLLSLPNLHSLHQVPFLLLILEKNVSFYHLPSWSFLTGAQ